MRRHALRVLAGCLVFAAVGCRCLEPVPEGVDSGHADAGHDGGGTGGGTGGNDGGSLACVTRADCSVPQPPLCPYGQDGGFSCIDDRCVFECQPGRSCGFDAGSSCLSCQAPAESSCVDANCGAAVLQGAVETVSGCHLPFDSVLLVPRAGCQYEVNAADGGVVGTITRLGNGELVGTFPGLGTCVGQSLFTQVERWLFSCQGCQFVVRL